jgi:hypothetical protein
MNRVQKTLQTVALASGLGTFVFVGCGGEDSVDGRPTDGVTGAACETAEDCYPNVTPEDLSGDAVCSERVQGGYCTHECESDDDCCGAEGECLAGVHQVCSPFESSEAMTCFLSCEEEDLDAAADDWEVPPEDESDYCQRGAGESFICRSSGGGTDNRKICVPGDCGVGADCTEDTDCSGDLSCFLGVGGGYCTELGCEVDADCPDDTACAVLAGETVCLKTCTADSDCSFCRAASQAGACRDDAELVEAVDTSVCQPN